MRLPLEKCPQCNRKVNDGKYCIYCGYEYALYTPPEKPAYNPPETPPRNAPDAEELKYEAPFSSNKKEQYWSPEKPAYNSTNENSRQDTPVFKEAKPDKTAHENSNENYVPRSFAKATAAQKPQNNSFSIIAMLLVFIAFILLFIFFKNTKSKTSDPVSTSSPERTSAPGPYQATGVTLPQYYYLDG